MSNKMEGISRTSNINSENKLDMPLDDIIRSNVKQRQSTQRRNRVDGMRGIESTSKPDISNLKPKPIRQTRYQTSPLVRQRRDARNQGRRNIFPKERLTISVTNNKIRPNMRPSNNMRPSTIRPSNNMMRPSNNMMRPSNNLRPTKMISLRRRPVFLIELTET